MINVSGCSKTFTIHKKAPGLAGSLASLFLRRKTIITALDNVSFDIGEGEIVGLVGANGAGKTTLVKILAGIIHPDQGTVNVMGQTPWQRKNAFRSSISLIMGQKAQLWWDLPAADCFLLIREIYRVDPKAFDERLDFLSSTLDVKKQLTTQIRRLSLGERMKMELIAALLHNPKIVFFDEPTIGLDLTAQKAIRSFILSYRDREKPAMIITSHYMEDIKSLCKRIMIMRSGKIVYDGSLSHIVNEHASHKIIRVVVEDAAVMDDPSHLLPSQLGALSTRHERVLEFAVTRTRAPEAAAIILSKLAVEDLTISEPDIGTVVESIMKEGI